MRIADVLRTKGSDVVTVPPDTAVRDLLAVLAEFGIGAAVVSADTSTVDGIVSERDVVRALAARGAGVLDDEVASIMTREVTTATPDDTTTGAFVVMTEQRIRHIPVLVDNRLAGLVSIGDLVKRRLSELEIERDSLEFYIRSAAT
ncbi:MAG: CBS domain-containing protein [Acidimicrobiales bacterium]|jgi:CBS domain-containing protein|nr:CBS domain-containing protein [Acidimicrobiales bacterium]